MQNINLTNKNIDPNLANVEGTNDLNISCSYATRGCGMKLAQNDLFPHQIICPFSQYCRYCNSTNLDIVESVGLDNHSNMDCLKRQIESAILWISSIVYTLSNTLPDKTRSIERILYETSSVVNSRPSETLSNVCKLYANEYKRTNLQNEQDLNVKDVEYSFQDKDNYQLPDLKNNQEIKIKLESQKLQNLLDAKDIIELEDHDLNEPNLRELLDIQVQENQKNAFKIHTKEVYALIILPNNLLVSGSGDYSIRIWRVEDGICIRTLKGHTGRVYSLSLIADNQIASGSSDYSIRFWQTETGICIRIIEVHTGTVFALAALPNGQLASGGGDATIRIWSTADGTCLRTYKGKQKYPIWALAALPKNQLASGCRGNYIIIWKAESQDYIRILQGHTSDICCLQALAYDQLVSGSADKTVRIWQVDEGTCLHVLEGHSGIVYALIALPNGQIASGSSDCTIRIWRTWKGLCIRKVNLNSFTYSLNYDFESKSMFAGLESGEIIMFK